MRIMPFYLKQVRAKLGHPWGYLLSGDSVCHLLLNVKAQMKIEQDNAHSNTHNLSSQNTKTFAKWQAVATFSFTKMNMLTKSLAFFVQLC